MTILEIALITLVMSIVILIVKVTLFIGEIRTDVRDMKKKLQMVEHVPLLTFRIERLEQHNDLEPIHLPNGATP